MKREILFRGKRVDNGEWVVGFYYYSVRYSSHFIKVSVEDENFFSEYDIEVDPETVGQFTGLTDKNGTKIFEDDVLECADPNDGEKYITTFFASLVNGLVFANTVLSRQLTMHDYDWPDEIEVIGNIHDNPELIK